MKRNGKVGSNAVIMPGVTIGTNSIVGANSLISKHVPANEVWFGTPARFIDSAIQDALNLTISRHVFEIIIVDDSAIYDTAEVLRRFGGETRLVRTAHVGPVGAANLEIAETRANLFILFDSDDQFETSILEKLWQVIVASQTDFAFCDYYERMIEGGEEVVVSLKDNVFNSVAAEMLFRKNVIQDAGGCDPSLLFPGYDLLIKLVKRGHKGIHVPLPFFTCNRHQSSLTAEREFVERDFKQLLDRHGDVKGIRA